MTSYGAMAVRYLKQQRKKTMLTVVGIILSVALISSLGTMGHALKDNMILNTKYEEGSFYYGYFKPDPELYKTLQNHVLVDQIGVYRKGGTVTLQDDYSLRISMVDGEGFQLLPFHLHEGRLPAADNELIVEQWLLDKLPGTPGLNDSTQLTGPDGKPHAYRIVGILNNQKSSQTKGEPEAFTFADAAHIKIDSEARVFLTLKPDVDINQQIEAFKKLNENMITNHQLLALMGESADNQLNLTLAVIFGTLVGLVVLSTVAVIYNTFHIAVLERIRQFGLLRTLGATPGQIRSLVFREATLLSAIGVPLGLLVGWFGLWFALWLMTESGMKIMMMETFELTFHWWIIGGSFVIGFAAVYLAAWLPARKASSVSPVEAVKGAGSIVRESYKRMRFPSLLGLMGIEGRMASTNIRRNRTKFLITTFSIVISITLFIAFHYFTQQALTMTTTTNENDRVAFSLYNNLFVNENGKPQQIVSDEEMTELGEIPGVYGVYSNYETLDQNVLVPDQTFNRDFTEKTGSMFEQINGNQVVYSRLYLYDEARLAEAAKYLEAGTADQQKLADQDSVILVQTVKSLTTDGKKEILPITRYKVGDKLSLMVEHSSSPSAKQIREVTVAGILTQSPFGSPYEENILTIIAARPTFTKLLEASPGYEYIRESGIPRTGLDVAMKDGADSEPAKQRLEEIARSVPGSRLVDIAEEQKEQRNFNLQMKIFVYGFLVIIGVIGSLNIINTVQTNLLLRRKEIGLLQAVGMTMGQIRRMATLEGVWFGVIGSIWGTLLGAGFSYFLYRQLSTVQGFSFAFPWGPALLACGAAMLVGLLAVQGPLSRMEKANLLEELREEA